jgi:hypothetical protein
VQPRLEALEDMILPSASTLPAVLVASPPAVPSASAVTSYVFAMMEQRGQLIATIEQDLSNALYTVGQVIAQEVSAFEQQVDRIFGINPSPATQPSSSQPGSGSGSGALTTALNTSTQAHQPVTPQSGSGNGSGSSATAHENAPTLRVKPLTGSGSSGSSGSAGSGSAPAPITVTGTVWLDSNGDGYLNNNELGFPGTDAEPTQVDLYNVSTGVMVAQVRPDSNGNFKFTYTPPPGGGATEYQVAVALQQYYDATIEGRDSLIDSSGFYAEFSLAPGGSKAVGLAGLRSMNVNTTDDDANNKPIQNMTTLRDAIQTGNNGNNGPPWSAVTFYSAPNSALNGTISLLDPFDPIKTSYNIDGPAADTVTIQGQGFENPYRIFTVDGGVTSTISSLTIKGGYDTTDYGGGIYNAGNLTLTNDVITDNYTASDGGGVYNRIGANLRLSGVLISNNSAGFNGGGLDNAGTVTRITGSQIDNNTANESGGGISNALGTTTVSDSEINGNTAGNGGGGVENLGTGTFIMHGGAVSNNTCQGSGGGVSNVSGKMTMDSGATIENNQANHGGGIFTESGGTLTLNGNIIINNNKATNGSGGGIYITNATVNVSGGTISNNSASSMNSGGGIYNLSGSLTLKGGVTIGSGNTGLDGGGMYLGKSSTTNFNSVTVSGNNAEIGVGIYEQQGATVNPNPPKPPNLIDDDDSGGEHVQGP